MLGIPIVKNTEKDKFIGHFKRVNSNSDHPAHRQANPRNFPEFNSGTCTPAPLTWPAVAEIWSAVAPKIRN
jgi:hypothetical protein